MNYKEKYFKYKKKYLNLKKGGFLLPDENLLSDENFSNKFINEREKFFKKTDTLNKEIDEVRIEETFTIKKNQKYSIDYYFRYKGRQQEIKINFIYEDYDLLELDFSDEFIIPIEQFKQFKESANYEDNSEPYIISRKLFTEIYNKYEDFFDEVIKYNDTLESMEIKGVKKNDIIKENKEWNESYETFNTILVDVEDDLYYYFGEFYYNQVNNIDFRLKIKLFGKVIERIKLDIKFNELLNKYQPEDLQKKIINVIKLQIEKEWMEIKKRVFNNYFSNYKKFKFLLDEKKRLDKFEKILNEEKKNKIIFTHETEYPINIFKSGYLKAKRIRNFYNKSVINPVPINEKLNLNDENNKNVFIHQAATNIFTQILEKNPGGADQIIALWFYERENMIDNFSHIEKQINIKNKLDFRPPSFTKFRMILMIPRDDINTEYFAYFDRQHWNNKNRKDTEVPHIEFIDDNKERLINRLIKLINSNTTKISAKNREDIEKNIYKISSKVARSEPGTITQFDVSIDYVKLIIADISMKEEIDENINLFKNFNIVYTSRDFFFY